MALLTAQPKTYPVAAENFTAAAASDTIQPDTGLLLWVKNTNAATRDITVVVPGTKFGQPLADVVTTVPATTGERLIPLPNANELADPITGLITVTCTPAIAGVTYALVKV